MAAVVFAAVAYFVPGASWSPVSRFCLTRAIVERASFHITPCAPATGDRAVVENEYFSDKAPLPSFGAAPAYALFFRIAKLRHRVPAFRAEGTPENPATHVVVSPAFRNGLYVSSLFTSGVSAAVLALALFDVLRRRVGPVSAALGTMSTLVGTPLFPYATSFFGHTTAAALLFSAFALLDPRRRSASVASPVFAGALLAAAVGTEYVTAVPAALVAGAALYGEAGSRRWITAQRLAAGAVVPLVLLAGYHTACFGSPFRTGYSYVTHPAFAGGQSEGFFGITFVKLDALFGILFGRSRGLFYVSPLALVGVVAGARVLRKDKDPALTSGALVFGSLALINASYYLWDGGRALGPRHLVPALGFLGVGIGYAFERFRTVAALAAGVSVAVMVLTTAVALEVPPREDVIFEYLIPALRHGRIAIISGASNLGLLVGLGARGSLLPPLLGLVLGAGWLLRLGEEAARPGDASTGNAKEPA